MKKFISVLCVVLVVFCAMNVFESKSQALFVVDDATAIMIITSVIAGIALSEGIALATGSESVYTEMANAIWDYFVEGEAQGDVNVALEKMQLYGSFTIQAGKAYFALNQNGYNFFRSWLHNVDFNSIHYNANISISGNSFISLGSGAVLSNYTDKFSIGLKEQVLTLNHSGYTATYLPSGELTLTLNTDGTVIYRKNLVVPDSVKVLVLFQANQNGDIILMAGCKSHNNNTVLSETVEETTQAYTNMGFSSTVTVQSNNNSNNYSLVNGNVTSISYSGDYPYISVYVGSSRIAGLSIGSGEYKKKCLTAGCLLSNVNNVVVSPNTSGSMDNVNKPVLVDSVASALPNNTGIGRNQNLLIPVPGVFKDTTTNNTLSRSEVREYQDDETKEMTFIPNPSGYMGETGASMGVTVVNNTDVEPVDLPTYVPGYPVGVIPTDSPDITVTAGGDVFTTASAAEGTTAGTLEGDVADIKDGIGDLSAPLTPGDAQKGANKMKLPSLLFSKFPFCIPFDLYNGINQFNAEEECPVFDWPIQWSFFNTTLSYNIHIDFNNMSTLAKICQWFFSVSWIVVLILLTRKVIWK